MTESSTRREFLRTGVAAALACAVTSSATSGQAAAANADLILLNGRIATQDQRRPTASAVAIKDGKFLAVGSGKDVQTHRGDTTQVIDLRGRTVIPGLNDSHLHVIRGGLNFNMELRWDGVPQPGRCIAHAEGASPPHPAAAVGSRRRRLE